jgi:taurine---2-oxoglutarate transaminase
VENAAHIGEHVIGPALREIAERHPSVGEVRGMGVFWALDLVRDKETREPLVPYNASGADNAPMAEFAAACKRGGLWPFVNMNRTHVVPPCTITESEAKEGLAVLDEALSIADAHTARSAHASRRG